MTRFRHTWVCVDPDDGSIECVCGIDDNLPEPHPDDYGDPLFDRERPQDWSDELDDR